MQVHTHSCRVQVLSFSISVYVYGPVSPFIWQSLHRAQCVSRGIHVYVYTAFSHRDRGVNLHFLFSLGLGPKLITIIILHISIRLYYTAFRPSPLPQILKYVHARLIFWKGDNWTKRKWAILAKGQPPASYLTSIYCSAWVYEVYKKWTALFSINLGSYKSYRNGFYTGR